MTAREAEIVLALLRFLDGSQLLDPTDLMSDLETLIDAAGVALHGALPLDLDVLADTLTEVGQLHADSLAYQSDWDGEYEDEYRVVETAQVNGDRL